MTRGHVAAAVRAAVEDVVDPDLGIGLHVLSTVRSVQVDLRGQVRIEVGVVSSATVDDEIFRALLCSRAQAVDGVRGVTVRLGVLNGSERETVAQVVSALRQPAVPAPVVYAVASGKGGVGKSTLAASLAVALAGQGRSVGLLDADVWGYSVPQIFGVRGAPAVVGGRMVPLRAHGVRLMSLGFFVADNDPVVWRGPMLHKALTQFVVDTHWGGLDELVLDLPPGTGDVTLSVLELLPEASLVVVTTPQTAARVVASRVGAMAQDVYMPISGVVENMSGVACRVCGATTDVFGAGGGRALADELGVTLLGQVPLDVTVREAGDRGVPVAIADPTGPAARAVRDVADRLRPARRSLVGRPLGLTPVSR